MNALTPLVAAALVGCGLAFAGVGGAVYLAASDAGQQPTLELPGAPEDGS